MLVIEGKDVGTYTVEMEGAYRFRHRIFVEEQGWSDLRRPDGREIDQFDHEEAVHFLAYDDHGDIVGYSRLLPTTQPYLLSTVHPDMCTAPLPSDSRIWEWTRFGVRRDHRGDGRGLGHVGAQLVHAYVDWGLRNDVDAVVVEVSTLHLVKFVQCSFIIEMLGPARQMGPDLIVPIIARFNDDTLMQLGRVVTATQAPVLTANKAVAS